MSWSSPLFLSLCHPLPPLGTGKFLPWNWKVPPLELKSSKRGTDFGTRMYY